MEEEVPEEVVDEGLEEHDDDDEGQRRDDEHHQEDKEMEKAAAAAKNRQKPPWEKEAWEHYPDKPQNGKGKGYTMSSSSSSAGKGRGKAGRAWWSRQKSQGKWSAHPVGRRDAYGGEYTANGYKYGGVEYEQLDTHSKGFTLRVLAGLYEHNPNMCIMYLTCQGRNCFPMFQV